MDPPGWLMGSPSDESLICLNGWKSPAQNHGMTWVRMDLTDHPVPTPLPLLKLFSEGTQDHLLRIQLTYLRQIRI